jgi:hypothetical protein
MLVSRLDLKISKHLSDAQDDAIGRFMKEIVQWLCRTPTNLATFGSVKPA